MIITLTGDNRHDLRTTLQDIVRAYEADKGSLAVERFDAEEADLEHILHAVEATSLFSPEKLVVIENYEANKALIEQTEQLLAAVPETVTLVIVIHKLDKRASYGKLLKKETDFRELKILSLPETTQWLINQASTRGGTLSRSVAQYLIDTVGADQSRLANELDKLILFSPNISKETIDSLCERQATSTVFELLDAGFRGQQQKAIKLYEEQRRLQVEPLAIIGMIGWQLHILALVKAAGSTPAATIAKDAGVHPFVVQKSAALAKEMPRSKLRELVHHAVELEVTIKSRNLNADDAVKHFLLSL